MENATRIIALAWLTLASPSCSASAVTPATSADGGSPDGGVDFDATFKDGTSPQCSRWTFRGMLAGPDGKLATGDDVEGQYVAYDIDSAGRWFEATTVSDPGLDGKWETGDDPTQSLEKLTLAANGTEGDTFLYSAPGPDGKWGDAVASGRTGLFFDSQARIARVHDFGTAGKDGMWGTPDDSLTGWSRRTYGDGTTGSFLTREPFFSSSNLGADGIADTADDPPVSMSTTYHDFGTFADGAGPDGQWGTSDDHLSGRYTNEYSAKGYVTQEGYFTDPGPDHLWGTADDHQATNTTFRCLGTSADVILATGPGPDGVWRTADDVISVHLVWVGCDDRVCLGQAPALGVIVPN